MQMLLGYSFLRNPQCCIQWFKTNGTARKSNIRVFHSAWMNSH